MKVVFMGTAELSCASLAALANDKQFSVAAVVTQPDRPRGRDLKPQSSPVKVLAQKLDLPLLQPERARDEKFIAALRALQPELIVVAAYGQILPPSILDLPRHGCLNVHTSLLPKYRGAAPIQWAIAHGDAETGVTIMKMDAGLDTGPMLAQRRTPISPEDDSASLHDRLARLGAELLGQTIPDYVAGKIQPQPQPADGASLAPKIKKEDGRIDWGRPAQTIWNRLRAFTPWPGAFTFFDGKLLKIWKASLAQEVSHEGAPLHSSGLANGTILSADKNGILVLCGKDALMTIELQREGGKRMSAAEFLAGHALKAGEKFE
ncbi:MAG TPA: methionyl-tRNA formyltransferase [Candidatus Acidoferrales bacterium]|nr:methionyl-tRNA formyltransferase [Candidatus Acidoferrales bacterium]